MTVGVYSTTKLPDVPASIIFGTRRLLSGPKHVNIRNHMWHNKVTLYQNNIATIRLKIDAN